MDLNQLEISSPLRTIIKEFNPSEWGYSGRKFRKPKYLNKAVEIAKNEKILFSDDDGQFYADTIKSHYNALENYEFTAGAIIRDKFLNRISKSILQGTNYAFNRNFFTMVGGYDENFTNSMGGGDVDFWYRIYNYVTMNNTPIAYLPNAIQKVTSKSTRKKISHKLNPKEYTLKKHNLNLSGPMYKWFPEIRNKSNWMTIIDE